ncbi:Reductase C-terminal [Lentzea fradiae]|uniref:Reductase C-terminal n=1 Tax=Lentzea fradiae TaxID=200378 RepID=A0A1G7KX98_9PSEU|nr:FAD-dependent oxidoreductase [Lentzea fradiae]SDF41716.1 Reductase C-terminal [Lentzea fradiae]
MQHLVVVGASLAGLRAAGAARALKFPGRVTLVGDEEHLPYDRPPLSKAYLEAPDGPRVPQLPGADRLTSDLDVDLVLGAPATGLDPRARVLAVGDREIPFDALVIATGVRPRALPGADGLAGVHTLRTLDDAVAIRRKLDAGARTVVIGAGFIGSEVASSARSRGLPVTVVESLPTPLVRAVGTTAGAALAGLHARNGTDLRCGVSVEEVLGDDHVTGVRLSDGTVLDADLVVVGIGAEPATAWLSGSGLTLDNGVVCDATLAAAPGVHAAGDVARWHNPAFDRLMRLEHWTSAAEQGAHAVRNALDPAAATPYRHVPYFWSDWYGSRIQFAGVPHGEPEIVDGGWDEPSFAALYRDGDRLAGVVTLDKRADVMKYRALITRGGSWSDGLELAAQRRSAAA